MLAVRYFTGAAALAGIVAAFGFAGVRVRRRALPEWSGAEAVLASVVGALAMFYAACHLLGALGAFHLAGLLLAAIVVTLIAAFALRPRPVSSARSSAAPSPPRAIGSTEIVAVIAMVFVAALWVGPSVAAWAGGITGYDSLHYHLPIAARYAQLHRITELHFTQPGDESPFSPANNSLVHATGMLAFGRDLVSPVVNLAWLAATLLAAWCVGKAKGRGPLVLITVSALLAAPLLVRFEPGSALNDIIDLFAVLACAAFLLRAERARAALAFAGVAVGLGLANKFSSVVVLGAITVGVLVFPPPSRTRRDVALLWLPFSVGVGVFWYARNWIRAGSPLPAIDLPGFPHASLSVVERRGFSVADYLFDATVWRNFFFGGLQQMFGPLWFVLIGVFVAGVCCAFRRGSRVERVLAVAAIVGTVAYILTPEGAQGTPGNPAVFAYNLRFWTPALVIGLALAALGTVASRRVLIAGAVAIASAQLPFHPFATRWQDRLTTAPAVIGVAIVGPAVIAPLVVWRLRREPRTPLRFPARSLAIAGAVVLVAGWPLSHVYFERRYNEGANPGLSMVYRWAHDVRDARIAIAGFRVQYPVYGVALDNFVQHVGRVEPHGSFEDYDRCDAWLAAVAKGNYDFVVTAPDQGGKIVPQTAWAQRSPALVPIQQLGDAHVFAVRGAIDPAVCT